MRGGPEAQSSPSVSVRAFHETDRARWDAYVEGHADATFAQLTPLREVMRRDGVRARWSVAIRDGQIVGVLPMFLRVARERVLFSAPGGLLADDDGARQALVQHLADDVRETGASYAELRDQRRPIDGLPSSQEHVTMVLHLQPTEDAQWAALDSRARRAYRKAERAGFVASWSRSNIAPFHRVLVEHMRDLGTPVRGLPYYEQFIRAFGDRSEVLLLRLAGVPAGGMVVLRLGVTWSDPWTASLRRYFAFAPNDAIYWHAICGAIAGGMKRVDFGRSQPGSGTFRFKRKWGADPVPTAYQYVLARRLRAPSFADQRASLEPAAWLWRRMPLPLACIFGDPLRRLFPELL